MQSPITSIIARDTLKSNEKINVLCCETHEAYETSLAKTNCEFHAYFSKGLKRWQSQYRPLPKNYHVYPDNVLPSVDLHVCLIQSKFGQFQALYPLAKQLHLPTIVLEHTTTMPNWTTEDIYKLKAMKGDINVFITNHSKAEWKCEEDEYRVINHSVDSELFKPKGKKENRILSVVNDFINRGNILGFKLWQSLVKDLPHLHVGDTAGLSRAANSVEELISFYQSSKIFVNTSLYSPLPKSLIEAMSCGCAIVTTDNSEMTHIIKNGENGFISNDPKKLRGYLELLLSDDKLAETMGNAARQTIIEQFSEEVFVNNWNKTFREAASIVYKG